ncbi:gliding motility-associated C-terminal domain-containing protein [Hymenobacter negativus]|uniref:Gliding motility-associated C-terminal domain-containing protein n=1 Tax=Hymenobacter negativus TaxID=2795026 RepID=A0ABS0QBH6_9BACT|nr:MULTISPECIES: gliding motility-associated C-terminal domain-containing protein [Bacteria]MBH8560031.1 gliding motility-associated C-terminal domain-containing protein [Hymenobacter negativus]MBH8570558.1 gliding motility-associated C-terminal domain-containing protein [Hymenobacter negativus]MBR7210297.1 gliding motility-associated C-terminal domain-containing protein [Microvirga sp. STS02]
MRKILQSFIILLFACGLLGGLPSARASHLLGCDMTYTSLGNNQYRVKFRLYRDCSGIQASPFVLECRNGGCNASATVTAPLVQQGNTLAATPLCPSTPGSCASPSSLYPLYDFTNYEATVTLPPGQWTMSTSQGSRPTIANIVGSPDLYAEAYLDNRNSGTTTVANTSPQFDPQDIPIQYVCVNQRTTFGFSAIEPDGDSLVYALAAPLGACGTPVTYTAYPGANAGGVFIITRSPLCILEIPGLTGGTLFTPRLPIPVATDTTGTCPIKQGVPYFGLNQTARTVTFTPNVYSPATSAADGRNKYQVVVEVTEYRRINGARRIVGRVRREAVLIVINCGGNTTPNPVQATNQTPNSNTGTVNTADTTQISVYSCNYSRVLVNFTDPDNLRTPSAHQQLTVTLPSNINTDPNYLASGDVGTFTLTGNGTENPRGVFFFQPSPSQVGRTIRINVRVEDNACPVKGLQNRVIVIKILRGNFASAVAAVGGSTVQGAAAICRGSSLSLQGRVIRPDSVRRLATNTTQPQVYTFQWTASAGGTGLPAVTNVQNISVNPTTTTRYFLRIAPTLGFAQGACGDTTSILVRVVAPPVARLVTNNAYICPGGTATLQASATPAGGGTPGTYTYRFSPANGLAAADLTKANPTVTPTVTTRYYVTASGSAPTSCTDTTSVLVRVLPGVKADFTTADSVGLNGQRTNRPPVIFTFKDATNFTGLPQGSTTTYKWTYERIKDIANNRVSGTETTFGTTTATPGPLQLGVSGYYRIRLTTFVSIVNGGVTTACTPSVKERIVLVPDLQIPNVITPNGDNQNDVFKVSTAGTLSKLEIYNRWGRKVYEQANYQNNWGGDNQPAGVYYYLLTSSNGAQTKGWIEIVR